MCWPSCLWSKKPWAIWSCTVSLCSPSWWAFHASQLLPMGIEDEVKTYHVLGLRWHFLYMSPVGTTYRLSLTSPVRSWEMSLQAILFCINVSQTRRPSQNKPLDMACRFLLFDCETCRVQHASACAPCQTSLFCNKITANLHIGLCVFLMVQPVF